MELVQRSFWLPEMCKSYRPLSFSWTMATHRRCFNSCGGKEWRKFTSYTLAHVHTHTHAHTQPSHPPRFSPKVLSLDLSLPSSLPEKVGEALQAFGRVDILINNAGISSRGSAMETDISVDRKVMEVNFFGTVALTKGACELSLAVQLSAHSRLLLHCSLCDSSPSPSPSLSGLLPSMVEQGGGHVVVVSSLQGKIGLPHRSSCEHP